MEELLKSLKWVQSDSNKKFHTLDGINRTVSPGHVTKLVRSLKTMGNVRPLVCSLISFIDDVKRLYIIDGQHAYSALLRLGWDIPYVLIDIKDKQDLIEKIALLNASSKSWTMLDYINAWSSINTEYQKLKKYYRIFDFELTILAAILHHDKISYSGEGGSNSMSKIIKLGQFRIAKEQDSVKRLGYITDALNIVGRRDRASNRFFCAQLNSYILQEEDNYNHLKMLSFLEKNKSSIIGITQDSNSFRSFLKGVRN